MEFRYFSCVEGSAVRRFGTDVTIGAKVVPGEGYVFDPEAVIAIPAAECRRYVREYNNVLRKGRTGKPCLVERTEKDYRKYIASLEGATEGGGDAETIVPGEPAEKPPKRRSTGRRRVASSGGKD